MVWLIWIGALMLLALWSALMWGAHAIWGVLAGLPWSQGVEQMQKIDWVAVFGPWLGAWLGPWFGALWQDTVAALAPLVQWLSGLVVSSGGWVDTLVVAAIWIVWAMGSLALLAAAVAGTVGLAWWRRRQRPVAQPA